MRSIIADHWFLLALMLGVGVSLTWPDAMHPVTDMWEPRRTVAISLLLVAWTMPTQSLADELRNPWAAIWAIVLSYGLLPLSALGLGLVAPSEDVQVGLILVASVPCTLSSAILWTRLAGGNEATSLLAVAGTTFASWLLTTAWLYALTGAAIDFDVAAMMLDLFISLIAPVLIGQALRLSTASAEFAERHKVLLGVFSQGFILAIVLKAGVTVGDSLRRQDAADASALFAWSVGLAISLHAIAIVISWYSASLLGIDHGRRIAVAFSASQKTLQIALVLYEEYFKSRYPFAVLPLLFYHVGQLVIDMFLASYWRAQQATDPIHEGHEDH